MRQRWLLLSSLLLATLDSRATAAPDDVVIEACAGPTGELRLAPEGCRPSEEPIAWQRGGGVFVHDADGRALGRSLGQGGFFVGVYVDGLGLRVPLDAVRGTLPATVIGFTEPGCRGVPVGSGRPGDVVSPSDFGPFYVVTERRTIATRRSRLIGSFCQDLSPSTLAFRELDPLTDDLGFSIPVHVPLQFGSGPVGAHPDEFVHACAGPRGRLSLAQGPGACRRAERSLAWQRLGGLRVYDGLGRDVGAALGTNVSGVHGILLAQGAWIEPDPLRGNLAEPLVRAYAEPDCRGESYLREFWTQPAGEVLAAGTPQAFVITSREVVRDASYRSLGGSGNCANVAGTLTGSRLLPYTGPLPDLPLPVPLVVGFPGSPVANPAGLALPAGLIHACAGPQGQLRVVDEEARCLSAERAIRWPRRGGLRALDAHGNDLGAFLEHAASNTIGATMPIFDDTSGLRFGVQHIGGQLGDDGTVTSAEISWDQPACRGTAFRFNESQVGQVLPFGSVIFVGTRLDSLVQRSARRAAFGCERRTLFPEPFLSTVLEWFTGVVPFPVPVATPLLVGPGN